MKNQSLVHKLVLIIMLITWLSSACVTAVPTVTYAPTLTPSPVPTHTLTATLTTTATPSPTTTASPPATSTATLAPTSTASPTPMPDPLAGVLVISVDGLRPDALQQAETPNIDALIARGAVAWQAKTTLPSATLPGHASMLSGSSPAVHGVTWNSHEPQRGHVPVATLFSVAHAAGLTTAMFVGKPKLEHIAIPGTVDTYGYIAGGDAALALAVAQSLPSAVPDVLFVHLPGVDGAGHSYGWMSPGQLEAVSRADAAIAVILKALETLDRLGQTLVILTADHGGLGTLHGGSQPESMNIPWIIAGPGVQSGFEIQTDVRVYDTAATAVWALGLALPDSWEGRPIEEAFIQ